MEVEQHQHKGLIITRQGNRDMQMLIHQDTLNDWLDSLPVDSRGWRAFNLRELASKRFNGYFVKVKFLPEKPVLTEGQGDEKQ